METNCMNELFGTAETNKVQIYTKTDKENTSILVTENNKDIHFAQVLDISELTGIQRAASFIKTTYENPVTEIFADTVRMQDVLNDPFIQRCHISPRMGLYPDEFLQNRCERMLKTKYIDFVIKTKNFIR